jgi:hypothetical protein
MEPRELAVVRRFARRGDGGACLQKVDRRTLVGSLLEVTGVEGEPTMRRATIFQTSQPWLRHDFVLGGAISIRNFSITTAVALSLPG